MPRIVILDRARALLIAMDDASDRDSRSGSVRFSSR
jgi:hypothetical protein